VVESGGIFKVVPEADAKLQAGTVSVGEVGRRGDQVITQIFRLNYENANNLVPVLRPLISPNNTINANPGNNSLVITDYADNLQRIAKIIAAMDTPASGEVEVIPLQHAAASDIALLAQRLTEPTPGAVTVPGATAGSATVLADPRSNSLLVRAANPARMNAIRAVVAKLDRSISAGNPMGNIWVVYLKNADAVKLAAVLRAAFARRRRRRGHARGGARTPAARATAPDHAPAAARRRRRRRRSRVAVALDRRLRAGRPGDQLADHHRARAAVPPVRAVIDQLDSRRAQVYIESMIVEVDRRQRGRLRLPVAGLIGKQGDKTASSAAPTSRSRANIIDLRSPAQGAARPAHWRHGGRRRPEHRPVRNYGGTYTLAAIMRILQSQTNTNIVSTPNLVTLDNEEAKIIVGSNVPFITGQFTNTGVATTSPFQTIERQGRRHHAAHQAADRRSRDGAHADLPGGLKPQLDGGAPAPATPARPPTSAPSSRRSWSMTARSSCWAASSRTATPTIAPRCRCSATFPSSARCSAARPARSGAPT
jgi:general secretion pathway protein D